MLESILAMPLVIHRYPASSPGLQDALEHIERDSARLGFATSTQMKLRLVVEELYTNTLRHGRAQPSSVVIITLTRTADDHAHVRFEDEGNAYDPFSTLETLPNRAALTKPVEDRPVGRLGLVLIQGLALSVSYSPTAVGNCIDVVVEDEVTNNTVQRGQH